MHKLNNYSAVTNSFSTTKLASQKHYFFQLRSWDGEGRKQTTESPFISFTLNTEFLIMMTPLPLTDGNVDKWNSRYLVLEGSTLIYYANETASTPRGVIDLTLARGTRDQGHTSLEWPRHLRGKGQNCFGLATTERTFYFYGRSSKDVKYV